MKDNQIETSEDERILCVQLELFGTASEEQIRLTLQLLKKFRDMELAVRDYLEHEADYKATIIEGESARKISGEEYYSNKTANAAMIIAEGQREVFEQYRTIIQTMRRAMGLILDEEARTGVYYRYIMGHSYKETLLFMKRGVKSATLDRRLKAGITSIANTLEQWKFFEVEWKF